MELFQIIGIITGSILMFEALAIYIVMIRKITPWNRLFNRANLYSDFIGGMMLCLFTVEHSLALKLSIIVLLALTHLYRSVRYFTGKKETSFLFNLPLFIINGIKFLLIIYYAFLIIQ